MANDSGNVRELIWAGEGRRWDWLLSFHKIVENWTRMALSQIELDVVVQRYSDCNSGLWNDTNDLFEQIEMEFSLSAWVVQFDFKIMFWNIRHEIILNKRSITFNMVMSLFALITRHIFKCKLSGLYFWAYMFKGFQKKW